MKYTNIFSKRSPKFIYKQISPVSADFLQSDGMKFRQTRRSKLSIFLMALRKFLTNILAVGP